ncbi:MAG: 4Fe-4S binding protein [Salinivirgaceae bacterium]
MGKKIVFCNCGGDIINRDRLQLIEGYCRQANAEITKLSDLCGITALRDEQLNGIFSKGNEYLMVGCYSRSLKLLLGGVIKPVDSISIQYLNFLEASNEQLFQEITSFVANSTQQQSFQEIDASTEWLSWFPVIDYSRCTACGQCADFCLFGVYEKTQGQVLVVNPQGCKNNCPACARICPQTAIVFPKYKQGGAISGSEVIDELAEQKRQVMDINSILGGDIYSALEQRKIKRQSIVRTEAMKKAMEERTQALKGSGTL